MRNPRIPNPRIRHPSSGNPLELCAAVSQAHPRQHPRGQPVPYRSWEKDSQVTAPGSSHTGAPSLPDTLKASSACTVAVVKTMHTLSWHHQPSQHVPGAAQGPALRPTARYQQGLDRSLDQWGTNPTVCHEWPQPHIPSPGDSPPQASFSLAVLQLEIETPQPVTGRLQPQRPPQRFVQPLRQRLRAPP